MRKVRARAFAVTLIVIGILALLGFFAVKYVRQGGRWSSFVSNGVAYTSGNLRAGTITDRDGEVLYKAVDGVTSYAADGLTRRATLHVIGDRGVKIGTGAIYRYAENILGWDPVNGLWDPDGVGDVLTLSIDADMQRAAIEALGEYRGAVAVINYMTGEVLCAASSPTFDPEDPPETVEEGSGVYLNRAISATFTPGSVFKLVTLTAAIESIPDLFERDFKCTGAYDIGGGKVTCPRSHGNMKIEDALASSCNCVFGALAVELGGERMGEYANKLGVTSSHGIDGLRTEAGRFDTAKDASLNLAWSGAGQYNTLVCPMAMARLCAAIANSGIAPSLTQIKGVTGDGERIMEPETAERIREIMDYCVYRTYGDENFPGLDMHAKSGTAETGAEKPTAWFTGFISDTDHPYAFAVTVENSGSGASIAGPIANAVLQAG